MEAGSSKADSAIFWKNLTKVGIAKDLPLQVGKKYQVSPKHLGGSRKRQVIKMLSFFAQTLKFSGTLGSTRHTMIPYLDFFNKAKNNFEALFFKLALLLSSLFHLHMR